MYDEFINTFIHYTKQELYCRYLITSPALQEKKIRVDVPRPKGGDFKERALGQEFRHISGERRYIKRYPLMFEGTLFRKPLMTGTLYTAGI